MSSNALGPNTRNITTNVEVDAYIGVNKLASVSGASMSEYIRALCDYAIKHNLIAGQNAEDHSRWLDAVQTGAKPVPKIRIEIKAGAPDRLKVYSPESEEHKTLRVAESTKGQKR